MATSAQTEKLATLKANLNKLRSKCSCSQDYRANIDRLIKLHRNIFTNPSEERFRRIIYTTASRKIWGDLPFVQDIMLDAGWVNEGKDVVFKDDDDLRDIIRVLTEERLNIVPNVTEWVKDNKVEKVNYNGWQDENELRLRQEAAAQRDKEYEKCIREKAELQAAAETIRRQIQLDAHDRAVKFEKERAFRTSAAATAAFRRTGDQNQSTRLRRPRASL